MTDWAEERAWDVIARKGWIPTPQLLFALKDEFQRVLDTPSTYTTIHTDWLEITDGR